MEDQDTVIMKIGVMSDTHLGRVSDVLQRIVEDYFKATEMILHAGDIVSGEVLAYLEARGVLAVYGNMCLPEVRQTVPGKRIIQAGPFKIGLTHGWGSPKGLPHRLRPEFDRIDCLVFGHSHNPVNERIGGELFFNPGTATPSAHHRATVGILHVTDEIKGEIITVD